MCVTNCVPELTVYALEPSENGIGYVEIDEIDYTLVVPSNVTEYNADDAYFVETDHKYGLKGKIELYDKINIDEDGITGSIPVTAIGREAFRDSDITEVVIPETVTSIKEKAFYSCDNLNAITIPDSVTSIKYEAFFGCDNLASATIGLAENSSAGRSKTTIGEGAFYACKNLSNVSLGENVKKIEKNAFRNTNLDGVTIPDGISTIFTKVLVGSNAFDESTVIVNKAGKKFTLLLTTDLSGFEIFMYALWIFLMFCGLLGITIPIWNPTCYVRDYDQKSSNVRKSI